VYSPQYALSRNSVVLILNQTEEYTPIMYCVDCGKKREAVMCGFYGYECGSAAASLSSKLWAC